MSYPGQDTYVVLNEYIDKKTANMLSKVVKGDKCSVFEMIKLMHELSHTFDINLGKQLTTREQILDPQFTENYPPVVDTYLCETTAIFLKQFFVIT